MAYPILVPQVGQDLTEGKILEINVNVGDQVKVGDMVATVESDKAAFEVEAFEEGTVLKICYGEGDWGTVLEPLMFVGTAGEVLDDAETPLPTAEVSSEREAGGEVIELAAVANTVGKLRSSPLARKIAVLEGLDIAQMAGTGPHGAIVKRDVLAVLEASAQGIKDAKVASKPIEPISTETPVDRAPVALVPDAEDGDQEIPHSRMRQIIADRLVASKQNVPHFYLQAEVDLTELLVRRKAFNESTGCKVTVNDILVRCSALTLMEHRELNAHVTNTSIIRKADINIGVAVSVKEGLMVPVVAGADRMDTLQISSEIRTLAEAARRGVSKMGAPGTFSISNLGMFGVNVLPIINPPEAAILGVGPTKEQVRSVRGGLHVRQIMTLNLSADHRAVDGGIAAVFLSRLVEVIETFKLDS